MGATPPAPRNSLSINELRRLLRGWSIPPVEDDLRASGQHVPAEDRHTLLARVAVTDDAVRPLEATAVAHLTGEFRRAGNRHRDLLATLPVAPARRRILLVGGARHFE